MKKITNTDLANTRYFVDLSELAGLPEEARRKLAALLTSIAGRETSGAAEGTLSDGFDDYLCADLNLRNDNTVYGYRCETGGEELTFLEFITAGLWPAAPETTHVIDGKEVSGSTIAAALKAYLG